jgi:hypothetical protein
MRYGSKHVALSLLALTAGCAAETREYCNRLNFCSLLSISVDRCTQEMDARLDAFSLERRDAFEFFLTGCLVQPSCDTFLVCIETSPTAIFATERDPGSTPASTRVPASPLQSRGGMPGESP